MEIDEKEQVREALSILVHAEQIKKDKELMPKVIAMAEKEKDAVKSIADLKKKYEEIVDKEKQPESMPTKEGLKKTKDGEDQVDKGDDKAILEKDREEVKGWKDIKKEESESKEE